MAETEFTIQVVKNGPLLVKGLVQVKDGDGQPIPVKAPTIALCRCGQSSKKPFCDGSHQKVGFQG